MAKKVFFSFHYDDVADFRVNVVRNHDMTKDGLEDAGYIDASMWEEAEIKGSSYLKSLIDGKLAGTTATAVLIGTDTYSRPWVRYELFKSVSMGSKVIGVHINGIPNKEKKTEPVGRNPLDYVALTFSVDGLSVTPKEYSGDAWTNFGLLGSWELEKQAAVEKRGKTIQLSNTRKVYDWVADDGYNNFGAWIN